MWFSPTVVKVILTALASVILLATGGHTGSTLLALAGMFLPFAVWWHHLKSKR